MGLMVLRNDGLVYLPGNWAESRFKTTINRSGLSQLTALSTDSGDLIDSPADKGRVYAGDTQGKVVVIDALQGTSSRKFLSPSSVAAFASDGDLIRSDTTSGPMHISRLQRIDASAEADDSGLLPIKSEYRTSEFPNTGSIYVNKISVNDKYVAAAGQSREGNGIVLVWDIESGNPIKRIDFPSEDGSSTLEKLPDIVTQVNFVDGGKKLLAFNVKSKVLTTWSTDDWSKDSFLLVGGDTSPSLDVSPDSNEILVLSGTKFSGTKAKRISVQNLQVTSVHDIGKSLGIWYTTPDEFVSLDAEQSMSIRTGSTMEVTRTMALPSAATSISPSPNGQLLALLQRDGSAGC
ncbi:WD40 repeat domain-containing protein [Arthrobacter alpinus]|nr:WD40 repeat domain-containing protein [Arthrobacter alpinus]